MILEGGNIYNHSGLSRNWLHQDMLPGNVQMRRRGYPKLCVNLRCGVE